VRASAVEKGRVFAELGDDNRLTRLNDFAGDAFAERIDAAGLLPPYFEGSFYGMRDTSEAFRAFARLLNDPELSARVETMVAREEARVMQALAPYRERLSGKRALVFTGGYKSWSVVSAMQDLGMVVVATGTEKSTEEDKARIRELMGEDARMIADNDQIGILDAFAECKADIMIAGDRYIYSTLKSRIPFLDIDHVRRIGYAGYTGLIELAKNLDLAVNSPVWGQLRDKPDWARDGAGRTRWPMS